MPVHDDLGKRLKEYYEAVPNIKLVRRMPVAIRLDGKAFHSFTKGFQKPFDEVLVKSMQETMKYLCENIQGTVFGYCQSDEITLILVDYKNLNTDAWFEYKVQKMCSISASMATMFFNRIFKENVHHWMSEQFVPISEPVTRLYNLYMERINKGAMFDARCFNIPKEEVANLIYWRQLDATRNSIQMVGQANFSHKELQFKTCDMIQEMLFQKRDINWNNFPTHLKRGSCCIKKVLESTIEGEKPRSKWFIDENIPIFKGEDREYIEKLIYFSEEG